jgi:hypothetical protein
MRLFTGFFFTAIKITLNITLSGSVNRLIKRWVPKYCLATLYQKRTVVITFPYTGIIKRKYCPDYQYSI